MIQLLVKKYQRPVAFLLLTLFYCDFTLAAYVPVLNWREQELSYARFTYNPALSVDDLFAVQSNTGTENDRQSDTYAEADQVADIGIVGADDNFGGGPSQPEMSAFQSVNSNNMVDLFTGDFSYNIPLMDVGGYPINLAYRSGIAMDQEASWVGLGWNINPGTITRNMRGVPDDFNGLADTVTKIASMKDNKTTGVTMGIGVEGIGLPLRVGINGGVFYNNYKGYGAEIGANASIATGQTAMGNLTAGLSINNNTQEGFTVSPSLSYQYSNKEETNGSGVTGNFSTSLSYNSRSGLKALQIAAGYSQNRIDADNQKKSFAPYIPSGSISFALPAYLPKITLPYTSHLYSFGGKLGVATYAFDVNFSISGYMAMQTLKDADTILTLPAYGYLNYQNGAANRYALMDFNRERELPYREKPEVPHIGLPSYSYDVFSMTGEGTGGMFRAYRGDIGFVYDHYMKSRDASDAASADVGLGLYAHAGIDLNINRSYTTTGSWVEENPLSDKIKFRSSDTTYEAVYFRNPGEKSINSKTFYEAVGGDDVVTAQVVQSDNKSPIIQASALLNRYKNKQFAGTVALTDGSVVKTGRDKRTQTISYLNADEASRFGFSKYLESYPVNKAGDSACNRKIVSVESPTGLKVYYYNNENCEGAPVDSSSNVDINNAWGNGRPIAQHDRFSARWIGFIKAPATGSYTFSTYSDDGVRLWINDSLVIDNWTIHAPVYNTSELRLVEGQMLSLRMEYFEHEGGADARLLWEYPGQAIVAIPTGSLYPPDQRDAVDVGNVRIEKRVNSFRKPSHISEIDVVNSDGRRYIYGIPVYNLLQKEVSFSVSASDGDAESGLVSYSTPKDISTKNDKGLDNYYTAEITPAYAHSFLLTSILSPDYVDITGDGVSDDDMGDAVKFNYSKVAGKDSAYTWRTPNPGENKMATYNEGLKTDDGDDKGSYVYGEKELWYMHSVESKSMVAVFLLSDVERKDLYPIDEIGRKSLQNPVRYLKEIRLFSKPDYLQNRLGATSIKTVHFDYSYELCKGVNTQRNDSGKLTLKRVWFTYNGNETGAENPYIFHYADKNPDYDGKSYDRWGNYKSNTDNPNDLTNAEFPYALQPNYDTYDNDSLKLAGNAAAWTLDSIILPSGGRMKVEYESDDYAYVQNKRALQMFTVAGLGYNTDDVVTNKLYTGSLLDFKDNLVVYATVNKPVNSTAEVYERYLQGLDTVYFRLAVMMPNANGKGAEFVPCYASIDAAGNYYGFKDAHTIWFKIKGINDKADGSGSNSPLAKTAIQFLRLNLPADAYEGPDIDDGLDFVTAVKLMGALSENTIELLTGYEPLARAKGFANTLIPDKSIVRLNNPDYRKMGGGLRVRRIKIYDNWNKATGQKESVYGQEYTYATTKEINGRKTSISSGVASYEPMIGGEENPFRVPIQYKSQASVLAPVTLGYTEEPLGETFFPAASVGYSKVRVRSINTAGRKSANGYEETSFYTTYDFPTITDRSMIDGNTKKRYKPGLSNFLRINAKNYLAISQGFKVELNDMNGKMRSQATYPETDADNPISYTENFYKVDNPVAEFKHLANTVWTINPQGEVDTTSIIGKDVEIMMDMREQYSQSIGANFSPNVDIFPLVFIPGILPSLIPLPQSEETKFRSSATTKIIQRYGILDSVVHIEKGSIVSTKNILFDSETGDVLLTRTQNEFDDPIYNFSYPAHWAYDGMGGAYKNINAVFKGLDIKDGKIINGLTSGRDTVFFAGGDELMVSSREKTGTGDCADNDIAHFPSFTKLWAVDRSLTDGGVKAVYFVDEDGKAFTGEDMTMKIIRSGRRNINTSVGTITSLKNPLIKTSGQYNLKLDSSTKIINTGAVEFKELWHVAEKRKLNQDSVCVSYSPDCTSGFCNCECLGKLFSYLQTSGRLFIQSADNISVTELVLDANAAGAGINIDECPVLSKNKAKLFYALTADSVSTQYRAAIGGCTIAWNSLTGNPVPFYRLHKKDNCTDNNVYYDSDNGSGSVTHQILQTGITGTQQPISSAVLTNGNIVVVGGNINTRNYSDGSDIGSATIMVFNTYGENVWSRSLGLDSSMSLNVKALSDGGFIMCGGKKENFAGEVWSTFAIRFNGSYNVTWAKNYSFNGGGLDENDDVVISEILPLSDGSFVLSGVHPPLSGVANGIIWKITANGDMSWAKDYNLTGSSDHMASLIQRGDTLVVTGFGIGATDYDFILSKIKIADGTVFSQNTIDMTIDLETSSPRDCDWAGKIYNAPDGGYYMTYTLTQDFTPAPLTDYYKEAVTGVLKLDVNLNPIKAYNFKYGADSLKHLSDAFIAEDGNMVIAMRQVIGNSDSWLHKINIEAGSILWNRRYEHLTGINRLYSISEKPGGAIFAAGEHKNTDTSKSEIFIMQTDADGTMPDGSCEDQPGAGNLQLVSPDLIPCSASFTQQQANLLKDSTRTSKKSAMNVATVSCHNIVDISLSGVVATQSLNLAVLTPEPVYTCGYFDDTTTIAKLSIESCCDSAFGVFCISAITDTILNPYRVGLLGNYRPNRSYVFYTDRAENDFSVQSDIRNNGAYKSFSPFWKFSSNKLVKDADTSFWVWNSEQTLFNQKGFELENRDPLGRYNAGLYGYNLTLPVGVVQNSKYRETAFEGFEDYTYFTRECDTTCTVSYRQMDYSVWSSFITTEQRHTGLYSLKKSSGDNNIALVYNLTPQGAATVTPAVAYATKTSCGYSVLDGIRTDSSALIKGFSPSAGDTVVIGGWVREMQDCAALAYTNNKVVIHYTKANGSITYDTASTIGNIVEGWQRFEKTAIIPADARQITIELQTDNTFNTYFDDLRIHPYNANMKSFVYDPVNLRLMAELDENNFATFYEYDDDGTLIRLKKETERGIQTIKETRSILSKRLN